MPRHATIDIADGDWTQITANDASSFTVHVTKGPIAVTRSGISAPAAGLAGAVTMQTGERLINQVTANFAPGTSGNRIWAYGLAGAGKAAVSHG